MSDPGTAWLAPLADALARTGLDPVDAVGYLGTVLTVSASAMGTMIPLRIVALLSSCAMIAYGCLAHAMPVVLTELIQIPFNAWRLYQMVRLVRDARAAASGDLALDWLAPFGAVARFRAGETIFRRGEAAAEMFVIQAGRYRIPENGLDLGPGAVVGELGMLSPGNRRTASLVCVEAGHALRLPYAEVRQLYYQNPEFGFYFLRLTSERLFQAAGRSGSPAGEAGAPEVGPRTGDDGAPPCLAAVSPSAA